MEIVIGISTVEIFLLGFLAGLLTGCLIAIFINFIRF